LPDKVKIGTEEYELNGVTMELDGSSCDVQGVKYSLSGSEATVIGTDSTLFSSDEITIPDHVIDENGKTYTVTDIADNMLGEVLKNNKTMARYYCDENGFKYKISGANATVVGTDSTLFQGGAIIIPDKVQIGTKEYDVTAIADNAFKGCTTLTEITIPYRVKSIAETTFNGCSPKITMELDGSSCDGQGVRYSFSDSKATVDGTDSTYFSGGAITIPDQVTDENGIIYPVTAIKAGAFAGCTGMTSIIIPYSVQSIAQTAFDEGCSLDIIMKIQLIAYKGIFDGQKIKETLIK
jgi:hypothetical protein